MSTPIQNPLKVLLRKQMKEVLQNLTIDVKNAQSEIVTTKVLHQIINCNLKKFLFFFLET